MDREPRNTFPGVSSQDRSHAAIAVSVGRQSLRAGPQDDTFPLHFPWLLAGLPSLLAVEWGHQLATWQVASLGAKGERGPKQKPQSFCSLVWEVTFCHFVPWSSHGGESLGSAHSQGEGLHKGLNTRRWGSLGARLDGCHKVLHVHFLFFL